MPLLSLFFAIIVSLLIVDFQNMMFVKSFSPTNSRTVVAPTFALCRRRLSMFATLANNGDTNSKRQQRPPTSLPPVPENGHRIVLIRHGESVFNNANIFTGTTSACGQLDASYHYYYLKCEPFSFPNTLSFIFLP